MPKKDEIKWLDSDGNLNEDLFIKNDIDWSEVQPTCVLPPKTPEEREYLFERDVHWFLDHWIIYRQDGTFVLNGKIEEFEAALKEFVDGYRSDW